MTAPINLNRARKNRERAERRAEADANAVRHGQTKAERILAATRNAKAARALDQHRIDEE